MGNGLVSPYHRFIRDPPDPDNSAYPIHAGFPRKRKERVMHMTKKELVSAGMDSTMRNYCAHYALMQYMCILDHPMNDKCSFIDHTHQNCLYNEYLISSMEFERDIRLQARQENIRRKKKFREEYVAAKEAQAEAQAAGGH